MRTCAMSALALVLWVGTACAQGAGGAAAPPAAPKDKAGYFANSDIQNIWRDLEARQVLNKRVLEGGTHSINVRIVTPKDAPLAHAASLDIWLWCRPAARPPNRPRRSAPPPIMLVSIETPEKDFDPSDKERAR